jgi:transcriptional regulator GlxA family with amidase domain
MSDNSRSGLNRRQLIAGSTAILGAAAIAKSAQAPSPAAGLGKLPLPADNKPVKVAVLIDEGATIIDFCGPWEVFQDASKGDDSLFELFTVAPSTKPLSASGGMKIVPDYSLANAPPANVIVIPAQAGGRNPKMAGAKPEWLRSQRAHTDIIVSICTGAFLLAQSGLLDGLTATTHHLFYDDFQRMFPRVKLVKNRRFIDHGNIMSASGLTSGIDGALHVVERYYGSDTALKTAEYMEFHRRPMDIRA